MDWSIDVYVWLGAIVPEVYLIGSKMNGVSFIRVAFFSFPDPLFFHSTLSRSLGGVHFPI